MSHPVLAVSMYGAAGTLDLWIDLAAILALVRAPKPGSKGESRYTHHAGR